MNTRHLPFLCCTLLMISDAFAGDMPVVTGAPVPAITPVVTAKPVVPSAPATQITPVTTVKPVTPVLQPVPASPGVKGGNLGLLCDGKPGRSGGVTIGEKGANAGLLCDGKTGRSGGTIGKKGANAGLLCDGKTGHRPTAGAGRKGVKLDVAPSGGTSR